MCLAKTFNTLMVRMLGNPVLVLQKVWAGWGALGLPAAPPTPKTPCTARAWLCRLSPLLTRPPSPSLLPAPWAVVPLPPSSTHPFRPCPPKPIPTPRTPGADLSALKPCGRMRRLPQHTGPIEAGSSSLGLAAKSRHVPQRAAVRGG